MKVLAAAAAAFLLGLAACGGDDDDTNGPTDILTPVGTKVDTPTAAPDGGNGNAAPEPATPQLDEELTEIASDRFDAVVEPGATYLVDTIALAAEVSGDPGLNCETASNFAFGFTWQVQDPFPTDGVQLAWQLRRDSGPVEIANTPAGEQTVGCEVLTAVNSGPTPITVAIGYRAGVIR
ncbi:MAG TPA: hypothetical protein VMR52_12650 [Dehalococcoidia bacterium]|nr:hypothetical protein [Dehalococcoidia bacterium]